MTVVELNEHEGAHPQNFRFHVGRIPCALLDGTTIEIVQNSEDDGEVQDVVWTRAPNYISTQERRHVLRVHKA